MNDTPTITRGGFLRGILAAGVAPAIIPVAEAHTVAGLRRGLALRQAMAGGAAKPQDVRTAITVAGGTIDFIFYIETGAEGIVDWGDGTSERVYSGTKVSHTLSQSLNEIKCSFCNNVNVEPRASLISIDKWDERLGAFTLADLFYRTATSLKHIAGGDNVSIGQWNFYTSFHTNYGDETSVGPFNFNRVSYQFSGCWCLKHIYMNTEITSGITGTLTTLGRDLTVDADGFKTIWHTKNTCASLLAVANFPFGALNQTKFECTDGYVAYQNGWKAFYT